MKRIIVILTFLLLVNACTTGGISEGEWPSPGKTYLNMFQAGRIQHIRNQGTYRLKKQPFAFMLPLRPYDSKNNKLYSARIACSTNPKILKMPTGISLDNDPRSAFFAGGTGLATSDSGRYDALHLTSFPSHHYIVYNDTNKMMQRAQVARKFGDGHLELMFDISKINTGRRDIPLKNIKIRKLFFVVYTDTNLNRIIDEEEIYRFTVIFEK